MSQTNPTGESPVTTAKPLARYSAVGARFASGFATAELHHVQGRDLTRRGRRLAAMREAEDDWT
jgi:hypothetical protein